jgi:hypothetical protein
MTKVSVKGVDVEERALGMIETIRRLELRPGDTLLAETRLELAPNYRVYLEKMFNRLFPNNQTLVMDGEWTFTVVAAVPAGPGA